MPLAERVKYEGDLSESVLVWRWPSEELSLGAQLVVQPSQEALLIKGGQALDLFGPGTHTLTTGNLPLLGNVLKLPFGGRTPFTAEIYFINKHAVLGIKWGTPDAWRVTDPTYDVILPVRSYGRCGIRVLESRSFFQQLIGVLHDISSDKIQRCFEGLLVASVKSCISKYILERGISVMAITAKLDEISKAVSEEITEEYERFGIEVVNFHVMSISIADNDPSVQRLQESMVSRLGPAQRLEQLKKLLERGLITSNDYDTAKRRILEEF